MLILWAENGSLCLLPKKAGANLLNVVRVIASRYNVSARLYVGNGLGPECPTLCRVLTVVLTVMFGTAAVRE